jgi:hypothetical protein
MKRIPIFEGITTAGPRVGQKSNLGPKLGSTPSRVGARPTKPSIPTKAKTAPKKTINKLKPSAVLKPQPGEEEDEDLGRREIDSSSLASVGYDPATSTLEVEFQHPDNPNREGAVYQYFRVPFSIWRKLWAAPSHGSYFYYNVRGEDYHRPPFKYRKIKGPS